jgi:O-antigen/teichoic acid export membrane protein
MSERRAFLGTIAMGIVNAARIGFQLLVLPILARLLGPEAFGLIGLAIPFILLTSVLADAGLGTALMRHQNPSSELESTVFWISSAIGLILTAILCALSWPIARMFARPDLAPVLATLSLILTFGGTMAVANARIARRRDFGIFAIADVLSTVVSATVGVGAAVFGLGVWSLVIQMLILWVTKALWVFPASGFRPQFVCKLKLAQPHLGFGINSAAANLSDFIGRNLPALVVGGTLGVTPLGHYSMAYQLTRVAELVISGPVNLSILTAVARTPDRREARTLVMGSLRIIVAALAFLFCGLALTADLATAILLGPKWSDTAPVLAALAPAGFFICLYSFLGAVFLGLGNSARQLTLSLLSSAAIFIGAAVGTRFDIVGVGTGVSLGAAAMVPAYVHALSRELKISVSTVVSNVIAPPVAAAAMVLMVLGVRLEIAHFPAALQLVAAMASGLIAYGAVFAVIEGRKFAEDIRRLKPGRADLSPESQVI